MKLKKRGDTYRPAKLAASIRMAGAKPSTVAMVMKSVKVKSGMSTLALRREVTSLLRMMDPKAAKRYAAHKK